MKNLLFTASFASLCAMQLFSQEPSVKILLDNEERFRFDSIRLEFINTGHHVMIGDSTGMDNYANSQTVESTFVGFKAGSSNLDGYNTFIGGRAGEYHRTGSDNVYIGGWAGRWDSIGRYNTYVGANAGFYNKKGQRNTFIGRNAGAYSDSCSGNTFLGYNAGVYTKGGNGNVYVGKDAGSNSGKNGSVSGNTYLGAGAGSNNENGLANVFIGFNAGAFEENQYCKLIIENSDTIAPLIYGDFFVPWLQLNVKYLEFGLGQDIRIGNHAGYNHDLGSTNVFIGNQAGYEQKRGWWNVLVGDSAGYANDTCSGNTYIGCKAGIYDSAGRYNVYVGYNTGKRNTSGILNAFVGTTCGISNSTGTENSFFGTSAGGYNTTGSYNTCIGRKAGLNNQTGSGNVFLGYFAGANELGSNKLYIANSETSEPLIGGDFTANKVYFNGKVGIGTSNPQSSALLDVSSTSQGFLPPRLTVLQQRMIENPATGLMVFNIDSLDLFIYTGSFWVSVLNCDDRDTILPWTCGDSITIHHLVSGGVAPVDKTVTYGSVTNIPGEPSKCWITSNLGADHQATVIDDNTEASAGWYWQFNRMQGYKHDGTTLTPGWTISSINENSDWLPENDPCALELGNGWRLPTYDEWSNVDASGGWTNWNGPWSSGLKLQSAGYLSDNDGSPTAHGNYGYYWSIEQGSIEEGITLHFDSNDYCGMNGFNKAAGISIRCIRDE